MRQQASSIMMIHSIDSILEALDERFNPQSGDLVFTAVPAVLDQLNRGMNYWQNCIRMADVSVASIYILTSNE